jgi:hypothetical protein
MLWLIIYIVHLLTQHFTAVSQGSTPQLQQFSNLCCEAHPQPFIAVSEKGIIVDFQFCPAFDQLIRSNGTLTILMNDFVYFGMSIDPFHWSELNR